MSTWVLEGALKPPQLSSGHTKDVGMECVSYLFTTPRCSQSKWKAAPAASITWLEHLPWARCCAFALVSQDFTTTHLKTSREALFSSSRETQQESPCCMGRDVLLGELNCSPWFSYGTFWWDLHLYLTSPGLNVRLQGFGDGVKIIWGPWTCPESKCGVLNCRTIEWTKMWSS
jgi:hypothetical protein